jgi:hypothetical protein
MYMIEIESNEMHKASDYAEKALKYMGKVMQCISSWEDESGYGERGNSYNSRYGNRYDEISERRGRYGSRGGSMGYRDEEEWDEEEWESMGERRGVRGSGRGRR